MFLWTGKRTLSSFVKTPAVETLTLQSQMAVSAAHHLTAPKTHEEWRTYHAIRRKVLFENRGVFGAYDENHPDEFAEDNHPLLLAHDGEFVGVIRVDVDGRTAIFRRVAIRDDRQRAGHGTVMLSLAEEFAREKGCDLIRSFVNPDAVGFYEACGFVHEQSTVEDSTHVPMCKKLA